MTGLPISGGRREPVPALQWHDISIELSTKSQFLNGNIGFGVVARLPSHDGWYDLRIDAAEIATLQAAVAAHEAIQMSHGAALRRRLAEDNQAAAIRAMEIRSDLHALIGDNINRKPWPTERPFVSRFPWIGFQQARGAVVRASGYDPDAASEWLVTHIVSAGEVDRVQAARIRFSPRALANLERRSLRETLREKFAPLIDQLHYRLEDEISTHPGCCAWYTPPSVFFSRNGDTDQLSLEDVEWHKMDLLAALDDEFKTAPAPQAEQVE